VVVLYGLTEVLGLFIHCLGATTEGLIPCNFFPELSESLISSLKRQKAAATAISENGHAKTKYWSCHIALCIFRGIHNVARHQCVTKSLTLFLAVAHTHFWD
jgi:stress-induced morphogen